MVEPRDKPTVDYQPPQGGVSPRLIRWLFTLTLLNTILLAGYVLGPGLASFTAQYHLSPAELSARYQAWRAARADEALRRSKRPAKIPIDARALAYTAPPQTLVYDDLPFPPFKPRRDPSTWPQPATQPTEFTALPQTVPGWGQLQNAQYSVLFMHERRADASTNARLVIVVVDPDARYANDGDRNLHEILAMAFEPTDPEHDLNCRAYHSYVWRTQGAGTQFSAGQIDPKNPARFTIPYLYDGQQGEIAGELLSKGAITLTPTGALGESWKDSVSSP